MDLGKSLSTKDFFNYYFAGVVWLLDLAVLLLPLSDQQSLTTSLQLVKSITDLISPIVLGILAVVLPYIVGFTLNPVCSLFSGALRRIFGDPKKWITDHSSKKHVGKRLLKSLLRVIVQQVQSIFGSEVSISQNNLDKWFFYIRAYVINNGGMASDLASRAQDLANLTESLFLPVPLFFCILGAKLTGLFGWIGILPWIVALVSIVLLGRRYFGLREYWVKHVYRSFLVIRGEKAH